jgi:glycosyltransferase involved in cell wall biosynthesis
VGSGVLLPAARQFVQAFGLSGRVTFHGATSHEIVKQLMRQADIFLQHSVTDPETGDEEGLPVAIQEAMAFALPVISTRHAGIPEAVVEGGTGCLVNEGDVSAMAGDIVTLARDPGLRQRMGTAGWERAKEHFSWERSRDQLLSALGLSAAPSDCGNGKLTQGDVVLPRLMTF